VRRKYIIKKILKKHPRTIKVKCKIDMKEDFYFHIDDIIKKLKGVD